MKCRDFYARTCNEEAAVGWLQEEGVFPPNNELPRCQTPGCEGNTRIFWRKIKDKTYPIARCGTCKKGKSIRHFNEFFTFLDSNGRAHSNLSICVIMEIVYFWIMDCKLIQVERLTGLSHPTIVDWFNLCRNVPERMWALRQKMGGPGATIQIDETLLRGKRKSNKGRLLLGDRRQSTQGDPSDYQDDNVITDQEDINTIDKGVDGTVNQGENISDNVSDDNNGRNYGNRIRGPWVFGLILKNDNGTYDSRFFVVEKRDKKTLEKIILQEVNLGSTIISDEWLAYNNLSNIGFTHLTVNHSTNFVDPETRAHTQLIEGCWAHLKTKIVKVMKNTSQDMLPSHLIEAWWRANNKTSLLGSFLRDLARTFRT